LGDLQIYPFALIGVLLGRLYVDLGAWVVPLFVAPILIARQAFASYLALRSAQQGILETLIHALEAKDHYTAGHAERVARYARLIGIELGFKTRRLERLHQAALMHDVGKLVVPNRLLKKPGKLTPDEFDHVRRHEPVSLELIRRIDFLLPIAPTIEAEFKDAADGAHEAPIEGRIIAVCDAYDAMTSTRAYRRALSQEVAFAELRDKAGGQFDAECVETLIRVLEDLGEQHGAGHEADVTEFDVPPPSAGIGSAGLGDLASDDREVPTP
jgi:HD-GYP domain-containing protein (c-di-GMP phosphodiesterase class II)